MTAQKNASDTFFSRRALLTGRPPTRFGIRGPLQYRSDRGLPPGTPTLASHFRRAGYDTAICGKWHLGMRRELGPNNFGFRYAYGCTGPWLDCYTHTVTDFEGSGDPVRQWHRNGELLDEPGHVTDLLAADAVRFITETRDKSKPFFLYVPFSAPHTPCQEEGRWLDPYNGKIENPSRRYFAAAVTHMDAALGRLRDAVRREGVEEETVLVFFSDNGGSAGGDFSRWLRVPRQYNMSYGDTSVLSSNLPLRGWKGQLYEGGIRVPAVICWPARLKPARVAAPLLVCVWPSLAAAAGAGADVPPPVEGRNQWPVIAGDARPEERTMYWADSRSQAVRRGPWKLLHFGARLEEGGFELYNLDEDRRESNDRSNDEPAVVNRLKAELSRQMSADVL